MLIEELDIADAEVAGQVLRLQRDAYAVEAQLIESDAIPQLHEQLDELMTRSLRWRGIRRDGRVVAAMAFSETRGEIDIDRLIVDPKRMRQGMATALLASLGSAPLVTVSTGTANLPAHRLYLGLGFEVAGESMPVPGLPVTHFVRER